MSKNEFLWELEKALEETNSKELIDANVEYYKNYIEEEVRKGKTEEEVVEELGEAYLIAKSIKDTMKASKKINESEDYNYQEYRKREPKKTDINKFSVLLMLVIVGIVAISLFLTALFLFAGLINIFLPILIPIVVVYLLYRLYIMYK